MTSVVPTNLIDSVRSMDGSRRFVSGAAVLVALVAMWLLVRWAMEPNWVPLYPERLPLGDVGRIVEQLDGLGTPYRLSEGGDAVLVPASQVQFARMELARVEIGVGACGSGKVFPLGAGSLEQELMRRRSIEEHLACTISQMEGVERAQVHLTLPEQNAFRRLSRPAKASVMLWPRRGARMSGDIVHGITLLVSSAVETLEPEQVAVVNARGGTLVSPSQENSATSQSTRELAVRQEVEGHLAQKAEAMLAPLLTPGEFQVQVSADLDFTVIERTSELWDPETQAIVREEAAEVPPGATGVGSPSYNSEERESRFSRTLENLSNAPGSIDRLTVAVVVNQRAEMFQGGNATASQLGTIDAIVRNAVGLDSTRGDQLVVTAVPFLLLDDSAMVDAGGEGGGGGGGGIDLMALAERFARPVVGLIGIIVTVIVVLRLLKTLRSTGGGGSRAIPAASSAGGGRSAGSVTPAKPEPPRLDTSSQLAQQVLHETQQSPEMAARVVRAWLSESTS